MSKHKPVRGYSDGYMLLARSVSSKGANCTAIPDGYVPSDAVVEAYRVAAAEEIVALEHQGAHSLGEYSQLVVVAGITAALAQIAKEASDA